VVRKTYVLLFVLSISFAGSAWANTINFNSGATNTSSSQLIFPGLIITGKIMGNINQSPFSSGTSADIYWGNLGFLGTTATTIPTAPASQYVGLGIGSDSATGPITFKEVLVFDFALPQDPKNAVLYGTTYSSTDLSFTLLGTNQLASGGSGAPADNVRVFLKFASGETTSFDINAGALSPNGLGNPSPDDLNWNYWLRWALNQVSYNDEHIVGLAIEQIYGSATNPNRQFGFGSITYEVPVPEPGTMLLLGTGLIGFAGIRRLKNKIRH
jgi:hypothetical protein